MNQAIGIIGLGIMGGAIARHLRDHDVDVYGYDISSEACVSAKSNGVVVCQNIDQLLLKSKLVFSSLPSEQAFISVIGSFLEHAKSDHVLVDLSTLSLKSKLDAYKLFEDKNLKIIDCPISGTGEQAKKADLVLYVSGEEEIYHNISPYLSMFSRMYRFVGPFGHGTKLKLAANLLVAIHNAATAEAINFALKSGIEEKIILELLGAGAAGSKVFDLRAPLMLRREYQPATMKLSNWKKDLDLIDHLGSDLGIDAPLFKATYDQYLKTIAAESPDDDTAAIIETYKKP